MKLLRNNQPAHRWIQSWSFLLNRLGFDLSMTGLRGNIPLIWSDLSSQLNPGWDSIHLGAGWLYWSRSIDQLHVYTQPVWFFACIMEWMLLHGQLLQNQTGTSSRSPLASFWLCPVHAVIATYKELSLRPTRPAALLLLSLCEHSTLPCDEPHQRGFCSVKELYPTGPGCKSHRAGKALSLYPIMSHCTRNTELHAEGNCIMIRCEWKRITEFSDPSWINPCKGKLDCVFSERIPRAVNVQLTSKPFLMWRSLFTHLLLFSFKQFWYQYI